MKILTNELGALLTCTENDISVFFERASSRTLLFLLKEKGLNKFFKMARDRNLEVAMHRKFGLDRLNKIRNELNLDKKLPALKIKPKGIPVLDDELTDRWIHEALEWILGVYDKPGKRSKAEHELLEATNLWYLERGEDYPVGEHPAISLAIFEKTCNWFKELKESDECVMALRCYPQYAARRRRELELAAKNLIAELANIGLWGDFAVMGFRWKEKVREIARKRWEINPRLPRSVIVRTLYDLLKGTGANVSKETIYKELSEIDPRTDKEKKMARGFRPGQFG